MLAASPMWSILLCSWWVMPNSLTPGTAAHQAPPPPLSPGVCSNSCPLSQWCHPTISSSAISFFFCVINNCYHRHHHHHHHHRCRPASCHASEPADGTRVAQRAVSIAENRPLTGRNGPWALAARSTGKPLSYLQLHKSVFVKSNTSFGINKRVVNYKPIPFKCKRKHSRNTEITKEKRLFPAVSHFRFESLII